MLSVRARHRLGEFLLDVDFEVPSDGVTVLFGPSGSGKSATLAVIAGALKPAEGHVELDGRVLLDTAKGRFILPERRRIGSVHQDARLFPHMPVSANLRYGWNRATGAKPITFDAVVAVLAIGHLLERRPADLSGGERQRVAIGRALLAQPTLLLMDEPLASLDAARKAEILPYLDALHRETSTPILYVTHDLTEARELGRRMVTLSAGSVTGVRTLSGPNEDDAGELRLRLARVGPEALAVQLMAEGIPESLARLSVAALLSDTPPWFETDQISTPQKRLHHR